MPVQLIFELLLSGIGFFLRFTSDKKDTKKWLAEASEKLRQKRLVRQAFVEKHARESHEYIVEKKKRQKNDLDS